MMINNALKGLIFPNKPFKLTQSNVLLSVSAVQGSEICPQSWVVESCSASSDCSPLITPRGCKKSARQPQTHGKEAAEQFAALSLQPDPHIVSWECARRLY